MKFDFEFFKNGNVFVHVKNRKELKTFLTACKNTCMLWRYGTTIFPENHELQDYSEHLDKIDQATQDIEKIKDIKLDIEILKEKIEKISDVDDFLKYRESIKYGLGELERNTTEYEVYKALAEGLREGERNGQ